MQRNFNKFKILATIKEFFVSRTIRFNFAVALIFIAILPATIINLFYFSKMNNFIDNKVISYNNEIIKQAGDQLEFLLSQVDIAQKQLIDISVTSQIFENYDQKPPEEKLAGVKLVDKSLQNVKRSFPIIDSLYLIGKDGNVYSDEYRNKDALLSKDWISKIKESQPDSLVVPTHTNEYSNVLGENKSEYAISFVRKISGYDKFQSINIVQVDLKYSMVKKIIESLATTDKDLVYITDSDDNIIYFPDSQYLGKNIHEINYKGFSDDKSNQRNGYMTTSYTLPSLGWKITGVIFTDNFTKELEQVKQISMIITIFTILFSILMSFILSNGIMSPINRIIKTMKKVGQGQFEIQVPESRNKDLRILTHSFNGMVIKIDQLMKNVIQKENEKLVVEMRALQSQINSHFLYNTLNTIKWMAVMEKSNTIAKAIVALVKILEYSCKNCDRIVPIEEELEFTRNYVFIQQMRYGSDINIQYDIDDSLYKHCILKLTLQPIIENSILHAFDGKRDNEEIMIKGSVINDYVAFEVSDNGSGMDETNIEKLTGMGIKNVNDRIKLNFGDAYGLTIISSQGHGTRVLITLPKITAEDIKNV